MGAFFICKKSKNLSTTFVEDVFARQKLTKYHKNSASDYDIYSFDKILSSETSYISDSEGNCLYTTGTLIYKGLGTTLSLKKILEDYKQGILDETDILGSFCLIFVIYNKIELLIDSMSIQNVFYNKTLDVISSSFLAVCYSEPELLLNVAAATECICTGSLIGPDTLVKSISRIEPNQIPKISGLKIRFIQRHEISDNSSYSFEQEVKNQNNRLISYFEKVKSLADEVGVDSGITGGHDSRLLMALALHKWNNVSFHSHYRKVKDDELRVVDEICRAMEISLKQVIVKAPEEMSGSEIKETIEDVFHFFDGNIRMHAYWTESYNTLEYRKKILGNARLGLSGIGGEQYRNMEGIFCFPWNYNNFIKYNILLNTCGNSFYSKRDLTEIINYIKLKVSDKLGINKNNTFINILNVKRYFNEVFIPARLGMRNNAENKVSFFLSPLADPYISFFSYKAIPHLGLAYRFQAKMISLLNPKLASINSTYGFNFIEGEPYFTKLKQLLQNIIPHNILQKRINNHPKNNNSEQFQLLLNKHPFLIEYVKVVKDAKLKVEIDSLLKKTDLLPLVLSLGYLIKKLNIKC